MTTTAATPHSRLLRTIGKLKRKGDRSPLFAQMRDSLRTAILDGRLRPGERLPGEIEFAHLIGLSPVTVGKALAELSREGLVLRNRKRGTFVAGVAHRRRARCGMVAIVLTEVAHAAHPFAGGIVQAAEQVLRGRGFSVCLVARNYLSEHKYDTPFAIPRDPNIVGTIILPEEADAQESRALLARMPVVFLHSVARVEGAGSVRIDVRSAMDQVTRHLSDLGHNRVGLILGPRDHMHPSVAEVRDTALKFLADQQMTVRDEWILHGRWAVDSGRAMCSRLLEQDQGPTAVICGDDFLAVGAVQAAQAAGVSVPDGLSVVGMNDMPVATMVSPRLTSVATPAGDIGTTLSQMLLDRIDGRVSSGDVTLEPYLVVRQSTGPWRDDQ